MEIDYSSKSNYKFTEQFKIIESYDQSSPDLHCYENINEVDDIIKMMEKVDINSLQEEIDVKLEDVQPYIITPKNPIKPIKKLRPKMKISHND